MKPLEIIQFEPGVQSGWQFNAVQMLLCETQLGCLSPYPANESKGNAQYRLCFRASRQPTYAVTKGI